LEYKNHKSLLKTLLTKYFCFFTFPVFSVGDKCGKLIDFVTARRCARLAAKRYFSNPFKITEKNYSTKSVSIYKKREDIAIAGKIKQTKGTKTDGSIEVIKIILLPSYTRVKR